MKSIKPGRGPSMMSGVVGIVMICFGILWTIVAGSFAPFMAIFGILWTAIAVITTVYNFKNATSKNRYSSFDITDSNEEPDPLNERFGNKVETETKETEEIESEYCPYCGTKVQGNYKFCNKCGKELP